MIYCYIFGKIMVYPIIFSYSCQFMYSNNSVDISVLFIRQLVGIPPTHFFISIMLGYPFIQTWKYKSRVIIRQIPTKFIVGTRQKLERDEAWL